MASSISTAVGHQEVSTMEISRNVGIASEGMLEVQKNIEGVAGSAAETDGMAQRVVLAANKLLDQSKIIDRSVKSFLEAVRKA